jgi:hypothetical protein
MKPVPPVNASIEREYESSHTQAWQSRQAIMSNSGWNALHDEAGMSTRHVQAASEPHALVNGGAMLPMQRILYAPSLTVIAV